MSIKLCKIKECNKKKHTKGLCSMHYARLLRHGDPLYLRDPFKTHISSSGYKRMSIKGIKIYEHRFIMEKLLGRLLKKGEWVHHKNGNRLDNSTDNLELITPQKHCNTHNRKWHITKELIMPLLGEGFSYRKIARKFNVTHPTIIRRAGGI